MNNRDRYHLSENPRKGIAQPPIGILQKDVSHEGNMHVRMATPYHAYGVAMCLRWLHHKDRMATPFRKGADSAPRSPCCWHR